MNIKTIFIALLRRIGLGEEVQREALSEAFGPCYVCKNVVDAKMVEINCSIRLRER